MFWGMNLQNTIEQMWKKEKKGKKGKKGKIYCDSFSMELSVAIYQNNPSKVGKTIRPDSNYRGTGKQSQIRKDMV